MRQRRYTRNKRGGVPTKPTRPPPLPPSSPYATSRSLRLRLPPSRPPPLPPSSPPSPYPREDNGYARKTRRREFFNKDDDNFDKQIQLNYWQQLPTNEPNLPKSDKNYLREFARLNPKKFSKHDHASLLPELYPESPKSPGMMSRLTSRFGKGLSSVGNYVTSAKNYFNGATRKNRGTEIGGKRRRRMRSRRYSRR